MCSKLIFLLLTAFLLVQFSVGKSIPDDDTAAAEDRSDSTSEEETEELALFLLVEFTEFTYVTLNIGKKLIQDVITDVNAMEDKSEALKIKTAKLTEFVNMLDKIDLNSKPIGLIDKNVGRNLVLLTKMEHLLETFNTTAIEKPNAEDLIIESSLKKHGIEKIAEEVKVKFLRYTKRFYVAADKHWDSLSPEEQNEHKVFAEWIKLFKQETDNEKKIMLFEKIIQLNEQTE